MLGKQVAKVIREVAKSGNKIVKLSTLQGTQAFQHFPSNDTNYSPFPQPTAKATVTQDFEHAKLFCMLQRSWYDVTLCSVFLKKKTLIQHVTNYNTYTNTFISSAQKKREHSELKRMYLLHWPVAITRPLNSAVISSDREAASVCNTGPHISSAPPCH